MRKDFLVMSKVAIMAIVFCGGCLEPVQAADQSPVSHEHGAGIVNIVIESGKIEIELEVPAEDIVGFESEPITNVQKESVKDGVFKLRQGEKIFIFPKETGCILAKTAIASALIEEDGDTHDRDDHKNEDKHSHEHTNEHQKHEDHGKDRHSEFSASYRFDCKNTSKVKYISVNFFKLFPSTQKLRVQFVSPNGQGSATMTPSATNISLN